MSNNYWDDEEDEDLDTDTFAGDSSDLLKKLRKAKRSDEKRIKELTEQLETFTKAQREQTVKQVLEQKGVNAKAARLIMKDLDDVSEESVTNWLTDNAELFGLKVDTQEKQEQDINRAALRQQDVITQNALTPERTEDMESKIASANSAEEILAILQAQQ